MNRYQGITVADLLTEATAHSDNIRAAADRLIQAAINSERLAPEEIETLRIVAHTYRVAGVAAARAADIAGRMARDADTMERADENKPAPKRRAR